MDITFIRSLLAVIFAGVSCSLMGVLLVSLRISFLGICMSHAAFLGVLISLLIGINPLIGAFVLVVITSGILGPISEKNKVTPETAIGIIFSGIIGIAFLLIKFIPNSQDAMNYLWGSILTITDGNVLVLALISLVSAILICLFYKQIQIVLFSKSLAISMGIKAKVILYAILLCSGIITAASIGSIGGLLVFALILNPALSAYNLTFSLKKMFGISVLFGVGACVLGLITAWYADLPIGACVVVISTVFYIISLMFSVKK